MRALNSSWWSHSRAATFESTLASFLSLVAPAQAPSTWPPPRSAMEMAFNNPRYAGFDTAGFGMAGSPCCDTFCSLATVSVTAQLQLGEKLVLEEAEEPVLVGADLVDVHVVEPGVEELPQAREMPFRVGPSRHALGQFLFCHVGRSLLEVGRLGKLLAQLTGEASGRPDLLHGAPGGGVVLRPADVRLRVAGAAAAGLLEVLDGVLVGPDADEAV